MSDQTDTSSTAPPIGTWVVDATSTRLTVTAKKLGVFSVPATLTIDRGTIAIADRAIDVTVVARADSYASANDKRNEHVRSADFLDADQHPDIVFSADELAAAGAGFSVAGTVTVKGNSTPLQFDVSDVSVDGDRASCSATAQVDRSALGVDKLPAFVIGNTLEIALDVSANREAPR